MLKGQNLIENPYNLPQQIRDIMEPSFAIGSVSNGWKQQIN